MFIQKKHQTKLKFIYFSEFVQSVVYSKRLTYLAKICFDKILEWSVFKTVMITCSKF